MSVNLLVKEDPGAYDELKDVLQSLHSLQQLLRELLCIVHIVLQNLGQLPAIVIIVTDSLNTP